jgi:hypothetical protein
MIFCIIKRMKTKKDHIFGAVAKSNRKIAETGKTDMSNPQIHDPALSWLDAGGAK